jgi:hypothetical protein
MEENKIRPSDVLRTVPPGISWTADEGSRPWMRPPKYTDLNDIAQTYVDRLSDPSAINDLLDALETKTPVGTLAEAIMLTGVHHGMHTLDAGILVVPVIMEMLTTIAMFNDIKTVNFQSDLEAGTKIHPRIVRQALLGSMEKIKEGVPTDATEVEAPPSVGLMAKPVTEENNGL